MPVHRGKDSTGSLFQYGNHDKRYYYKSGSITSKNEQKQKLSGWRER